LFGTAAAILLRPHRAAAAEPAFAVPAGACDCHTHIFGNAARFPLWSGRTYTPPEATVAGWQAIHRTLRMERGVLVQPSVYGTDNRCML